MGMAKKKSNVQKFWPRKRAGWGKQAGAPHDPEKQQQTLATQGGDPRHWHGDTGQLCKIHPTTKPGISGTGLRDRGNFTTKAAAAKLPRLISPLGLQ